jgi:hypothetical protein
MRDSKGDDRFGRYVHRELAPAEARQLARKSLDDPELFDELTYAAVASKAVAAARSRDNRVRSWRPRRLIAAGALAAAVVLASLYALRLRTPADIAPSAVHATLDPARGARDPVFLAADLPSGPDEQQVFRGVEAEAARPPKSSGAIVSLDGGIAVIDAGAVDGLTGGTALDVYRDGAIVGRLRLAAVFRERARGAVDGRLRAGDEARIPPAVHLPARLDHVRALAARGDLPAARRAADEAVEWASAAGLPDQPQVAAWNTAAVLRLLQSDRPGGEMLLRRALAACPRTNPSYPAILNNLAVLAESTGDRTRAREEYRRALQAADGDSAPAHAQRKVIESNLSRVGR